MHSNFDLSQIFATTTFNVLLHLYEKKLQRGKLNEVRVLAPTNKSLYLSTFLKMLKMDQKINYNELHPW